MIERASPNFDERAQGVALAYVVLHYTGMQDAQSALSRLCDPDAKVSAHYVIDEDGALVSLVSETKRAWHAGLSSWRGIKDMNSASIGIELVNPGHAFGYRPFPGAQIEALKKLLADIRTRQGLDARTCLLAHSDIAPMRKQDPGELFPWQALAGEGFGFWPFEERTDFLGNAGESDDFLAALASIGYDLTDAEAAVRAFQRRYYPHNITGKADPETERRAAVLKRLMGA